MEKLLMEKLLAQLRQQEGLKLYAYQDHLGFWSIGYGRMIDKRRGGGISIPEAEFMLENDVRKVDQILGDILKDEPVRRAAIMNMAYQLGLEGVMKFRKMWAAIGKKDWETAAREGLDSLWAKQTPERAVVVMEQLRTGRWK